MRVNNMDIIQEIKNFVPLCPQEQRDKAGILRFLAGNPDAFERENLTAHMTASAWVLSPDRRQVLMAYHNLYDSWSWLGGHADGDRDLLAAASAAAGTLDGLMSQGRTAMGQAIDKLGSLLGGLEDSDSPDYLDTLLDILGGNPEDYGAYFSQMVQTSVEPVYPIDNYGSAMAPFYSVLAIWVGGVMLVAILKPHARREGLVAPKPYQLFFGRYFLFFALSQIQAAVIVAGDLLVLKIQCVEPALLFATGAITSLVFSLLIYSLTISFGDVGKAIVVVVMVLQIAGSSGTFPIELLPDVYQKIYHIFPFPYAIDAMRECICGLYGLTWLKNIGCLLIFGAAALLIGLWVRKPFMGLNHFMEEKLEETEML